MNSSSTLFPYFQPIVGVASGKIVGYEALARQYNEQGRVVSAGSLFIRNDLDVDYLTELDRLVRWQAFQKFTELDVSNYLTINISGSWIDNVKNFNELPTLKMLDELNIDRGRIIIEITEAKADINKLKEIVKRYRQHGLRVAVDDFGAGFSQLERIMAIRPDIIKIDMRLFQQAAKGGIAGDIVELMTRLGKRTGCQIVCEGVESDEEFLFGLSCGAQFMQGYLFSGAEGEFKMPDTFELHVASLRKKFLRRRLPKEQERIEATNVIKNLIYKLQDVLQADFNLNHLAADHMFEKSGVLRFYLCDNDGTQISADFNFSDGKWFADSKKIGFNWSWRPYFYQLVALENTGDSNRIVTSERYRDFESEKMCKTFSLRLDSSRILLVDISAEWL